MDCEEGRRTALVGRETRARGDCKVGDELITVLGIDVGDCNVGDELITVLGIDVGSETNEVGCSVGVGS